MKKTLTKKQIEDYERMCRDRARGRILTAEGLSFICEMYHYDAEGIGKHFLELLPVMREEKETMYQK